MAAFDDYIAGRATEYSVTAGQAFVELHDGLIAFRVKRRGEVEALLAGYTALTGAREESTAMTATFIEKAGERLESVKDALREKRYMALDGLESLPVSPKQFIEDEIGRLGTEITELEEVERDEEALTKLQVTHAELSDQKRLSEEIEVIVERRNRLADHHRLDACRQKCITTGITRRITERRREILTPSLKAALHRELERLRLTHIPLDLSDRGEGAESIIEIELSTQQQIGDNSHVLSEGEQRALALACFLAELAEIGSDHGIIVDDPVSSLDHTRMMAVAERLAEEASRGRQVIVFTHSILFHQMLCTEALRVRVGQHCEWMSSAGNGRFGLLDDSQKPLQMKGTIERVQEIRKEFAAFTGAGYDHNDQKFRPTIISLYTYMRETWERIVEEVLFNNVVQRFRPDIMTQRLEAACIDPAADYPVIFEGMKRCSHYSGHDPATDLPPDLPEPEQISRDIEKLNGFADMALQRRKQLNKGPKHEVGVEAVLL